MAHPYFHRLSPTLNIAHRGGAGIAPENTLVAFRQAVALGCEILELDVQATRDGVLVVAHDPTLERCTDGAGRIDALEFAALRQLDAGHAFTQDGATFPFRGTGVRIPSLQEVLTDPALASVRLNVELKAEHPGLEPSFASVLRAHGAVARVCVGSEDDALAERIRDALPEACHFYPREALLRFALPALQGEAPPDEGWHVLDVPLTFQDLRVVTPALLQAVAKAGKWINVWTVDDPDELRRLVEERVGGIMTDRPDLLAAILRGRASSPGACDR
jgi:glycerophosphoryl diester phosphodiesterase